MRFWLMMMGGLAGMRGGVQAETIHVFLMGGQSNADGRASVTGLPEKLANPQGDVPIYYAVSGLKRGVIREMGLTTLRAGLSNTGEFGPEVTFGRGMADFFERQGGRIALIKYGNGGTSLARHWRAGGRWRRAGVVYRNFKRVVREGMAALRGEFPGATLKIAGMIWTQGESDANEMSGRYEGNLRAFIADVRKSYGEDLPFVIGELSENQTGTNWDAGGTDAHRDAVRRGQENVAGTTPNTGLVKTDSFGLSGDKLHFDAAGQVALGEAFAARMQELVRAAVRG